MTDKTMSPEERAIQWVQMNLKSANDCGDSKVVCANQVGEYIERAEIEKDARTIECERLRLALEAAGVVG